MEPNSSNISDIKPENFSLSAISSPLASAKLTEKILRIVSKMANFKMLCRGVKEVNKFFKNKKKGKGEVNFDCFVVLAGDVSPIDVISHIPVLCEKYNIPYIYTPSRQSLGVSAQTKRPTSVVLVKRPPEENKYFEKYERIKKVIEKYDEAEDEK